MAVALFGFPREHLVGHWVLMRDVGLGGPSLGWPSQQQDSPCLEDAFKGEMLPKPNKA